MGICLGMDGRVFGLKIFEPSEENPYCVVVNSADVTPRPDELHSTYNCKGAYVH